MTSNKTKEELFTLAGAIIPNFDDTTKYESLTPIDIFIPILDGYWNRCGQSIYDSLFPRCQFGNFKNELVSYNQGIKAEQERFLEQGIYGNLPITVISYLETASKIRSLLFQKVNSTQNEILKKLEEDILGAEEKVITLEYDAFVAIRDEIAKNVKRLQKTSEVISSLDVLTSFAEVAEDMNYCMPEVNSTGTIDIKNGRHPVIEKILGPRKFCRK